MLASVSAPFPTFESAFAWLASHTNYETMATQRYDARTYGLARVQRLLDAAGRPERGRHVVQIVGSKGKGSTATALAEIFRAAGMRTGLYTSPHLVSPRERIAIDGAPADEGLVCAALGSLRPHVERALARGERCTFFEILTAAALLTFAAAECEAVVLEAGMGGRLDATTAAECALTVLTNISLDHTRQLGESEAAIATEKAAAARPGRPLLSGEPPGSAAGRVIAASCARIGTELVCAERDYSLTSVETTFDRNAARARTRFVLHQPGRESVELEVPLLGEHQAENAALAALAAWTVRPFGRRIPLAAVRAGLAATRLPARLSVLGREPLVLVDGAHNPTSLARLAATIRDSVPHGRALFVFGMAADKDLPGALAALAPIASLLVATSSQQPRAAEPDALAALAAAAGIPCEPAPTPADALALARSRAGTDDVIVVTGSLYLCGAVLAPPAG